MHAIGPRVNVCFTHLMTMLFVLVAISSSGSYLQLRKSKPAVTVRPVQISRFRQLKRDSCDQAYLTFDLTADFTKAWSWNINHMYIYLVAEYQSATHPRNEVIVWDTILSHRRQALVKKRAQINKYSLRDHGYGLRGARVTLNFKYNILPYMGPLFYGQQGATTFTIPANYSMAPVRFD